MRRLLVALAVLSVACGGDSSTSPTTSIAGTWDLKTVNGSSLPFTFPPSQGTTLTITGSVLTITGNGTGTYTDALSYRLASGASTVNGTETELGTWSANGGAITFTTSDRNTYQGSVSGTTLTEIVDGFTQVYQKR